MPKPRRGPRRKNTVGAEGRGGVTDHRPAGEEVGEGEQGARRTSQGEFGRKEE